MQTNVYEIIVFVLIVVNYCARKVKEKCVKNIKKYLPFNTSLCNSENGKNSREMFGCIII